MAHQYRDLKRERMWRRHIDEQQGSGQTIRAYCNAITFAKRVLFLANRDRQTGPEAGGTEGRPAFVPSRDRHADYRRRADPHPLGEGHRVGFGRDAIAVCSPTC